MAKIISISNAKGGVGKTTTAINLAASLAVAEKNTLLIDIDPDGAAGTGLGFNRDNIKTGIFDIFSGRSGIMDAVHQTQLPHLSLIPCNVWSSDQENRLAEMAKNRFLLKQKIQDFVNQNNIRYDFIIIDTPPALGDLTIGALLASDSVLIPLQCGHFALKAVGRLMRIIREIKKTANPELEVEGILINFYENSTKVSRRALREARLVFQNLIFNTLIPKNSALGFAAFEEKPALMVNISATGARSYLSLGQEIIKRSK